MLRLGKDERSSVPSTRHPSSSSPSSFFPNFGEDTDRPPTHAENHASTTSNAAASRATRILKDQAARGERLLLEPPSATGGGRLWVLPGDRFTPKQPPVTSCCHGEHRNVRVRFGYSRVLLRTSLLFFLWKVLVIIIGLPDDIAASTEGMFTVHYKHMSVM